jgi:Concanavalin A-like lectin/glucanases superfamily
VRSPKTVLQPGRVWLRHIVLGRSTDPRAKQVLGKWYVPQDLRGVNGRHGFQVTDYDRRRDEEGSFGPLRFPNAAGYDGKLHRERFRIIAGGTPVPQADGSVVYQPNDASNGYRPGDEWFEIWREDDLLFVGTPTKARITRSTIELSGWDGLWMQKRTREFQAGFWCHAPRDVFEHYTQVWQVASGWAEDFETAAAAAAFTYSTAAQDDGKWRWQYGRVVDGKLRLQGPPNIAPLGLWGSSAVAIPMARGSTDPYVCVRMEAKIGLPASLPTGGYVRVGLVQGGSGSTGQGLELRFYGLGNAAAMSPDVDWGGQVQVPVTWRAGGVYNVVIEVRHRWTFFYLDGRLVAVLPTPRVPGGVWYPRVLPETGPISFPVDVHNLTVRRTRPFLSRSATVKGDLRLPGAPPSVGLKGSYFNDTQQAQLAGIDIELYRQRILNPTQEPYAIRVDPAVNFSAVVGAAPAWQPPGPPSGEFFSARWTGAIYLDLDNYDYALRALSDDRIRVWIGKTRFGEEYIDDWAAGVGHPMTMARGNWLKGGNAPGAAAPYTAPVGATGLLNGQRSGWYPIVIEFSQYQGGAGCVLQYMRSDQLNNWIAPGVTRQGHDIRALASLRRYFPLSDGDITTTAQSFDGTGGNTGTWNSAPAYRQGPSAGEIAPDFDTTKRVDAGNVPINTGAFSVEAWVQTDTVAGVSTIMRKESSFLFRRDLDRFSFDNVTTSTRAQSAIGSCVVGKWHHVVGTYDGTNLRLYVDGALAVTVPVAVGATNANALGIGFTPTGAIELWDGAIAHAAVWDRVLSLAEIQGRFNNGQPVGPHVKLSPLGIVEQQVRNDSHYDTLMALRDSFALQFTCKPMSLESGEFPGRVVPMVHEGRDTEKVICEDEVTDLLEEIDAENTADALMADAAGLADPNSATQLTAESLSYATLDAHLFVIEDYESLAEITDAAFLEQRLSSLLALHAAPWEQVSARPKGHRELLDTFPLSGQLAEFAWEPGDGIRRCYPSVGVVDDTPIAIMGFSRQATPAGLKVQTATTRQRPRSFRETLRKIARGMLNQARNYQGQIAQIQSGFGQVNSAGAGNDNTARMSLPVNLDKITKVELVVTYKADASNWTININGVSTGITVNRVGRYDVTAYKALNGAQQQMIAVLSGGTAGIEYQLVVTQRI